jgi:RimJ/RimL family protein N-acetyltransferase
VCPPATTYVVGVPLSPSRIVTARLVLAPVSDERAAAVVSGDVSAIATGEGWPHDDTLDGLRLALAHGHAAGWFVTLDGVVIGDCGTHGEPDEAGDVELGYGLAAPYRGRGYGTEVVMGLSRWLLGQDAVRRVVARRVAVDNTPSRRALERAGFLLESADEQHAWYALAGRCSKAAGTTGSTSKPVGGMEGRLLRPPGRSG